MLVWSFEPVANGGDSYSRKIQMEGLSDAGQSEGLETLCFPGNNNPPGKCELSAQLSVLSKWWVVLAFWNCLLLFVLRLEYVKDRVWLVDQAVEAMQLKCSMLLEESPRLTFLEACDRQCWWQKLQVMNLCNLSVCCQSTGSNDHRC